LRVWKRSIEDDLTTVASSAAFYVLLGSMPALAAVISIYGFFSDSDDVARLSTLISDVVPPDIANMLDQQIHRLIGQEHSAGRSLLTSLPWLAFLLFSANRGIRGVVKALNVIYDRTEERVLYMQLAVTMMMTIGMIAFIAVSIFAVLFLPMILGLLSVDANMAEKFGLVRWPALLLFAIGATALLLRFGPCRKDSNWKYILAASIVSAVLWLAMSILFSWYAQNFAKFSVLYGSLGSVVAFMTWLWLSTLAVLLGAELDAALTASNLKQHLSGKQAKDQE
jgi:membrane protein